MRRTSTEPAGFLDRVLPVEIAGVTERVAVAAAMWRGRGDERAADLAAGRAMREALNALAVTGRVVVGERDRGESGTLRPGEMVGAGGPALDVALDPLEGRTICAKSLPNALTLVAIAAEGGLMPAPDVYMEKIAIGPGYPDGLVGLDRTPRDNIHALAEAKGVPVREITVCILDRPRHARLVDAVRRAGASIRLIGDGDVAGAIHAGDPAETGIDICLGIGGAPEGVLAAAALHCRGGQMEGRLQLNTMEKRIRAEELGLGEIGRIFRLADMVRGEVAFAATGVTDGNLLGGVRFHPDRIETHTLVMDSWSKSVRDLRARHYDRAQFGL